MAISGFCRLLESRPLSFIVAGGGESMAEVQKVNVGLKATVCIADERVFADFTLTDSRGGYAVGSG